MTERDLEQVPGRLVTAVFETMKGFFPDLSVGDYMWIIQETGAQAAVLIKKDGGVDFPYIGKLPSRSTEPADVIDIASRMAQDLQDYVDEAKEGGSSVEGTQELVDEWEQIYAEVNRG
ncbi:MAG: hypothetical protein JMN25_17315 [gamma proteobacterium endosymbiont of Lamellibrachia anaximandri]|nr:hypothetical protein [gamma proteobacterium endosymbiont of Lamellibrachia anaximandri]